MAPYLSLTTPPAKRTVDFLKAALLDDFDNVKRLTQREEERLSDFITDEALPRAVDCHSRDAWVICQFSKSKALKERIQKLPFYEHWTARIQACRPSEEVLLQRLRSSTGMVIYLTEAHIDRHIADVRRAVCQLGCGYLGLVAKTAALAELAVASHGSWFMAAIAGEFQTEAMAIEAVAKFPHLFQYVYHPTFKVLQALFPENCDVAERLQWLPVDLDLKGLYATKTEEEAKSTLIDRIEKVRRDVEDTVARAELEKKITDMIGTMLASKPTRSTLEQIQRYMNARMGTPLASTKKKPAIGVRARSRPKKN